MTSVDLGACGGGGWTLVMKTDGTKVKSFSITTVRLKKVVLIRTVSFLSSLTQAYDEIIYNEITLKSPKQIKG